MTRQAFRNAISPAHGADAASRALTRGPRAGLAAMALRLGTRGAALALAAALALPTPALALARPRLAYRVNYAIGHSGVSRTTLGVYVGAVGETDVVVHNNRAKLFMPASTLKLVTSAAAFDRLGAYYRWETKAAVDATPTSGGVVDGNLYLIGGGDPTLATRARKKSLGIPGASYLDDLADAVKAAGVKRVRGALIADESFFDSRRIGNAWKTSYLSECAPLSGLTVDKNLTATKGRVSNPPLTAGRIFQRMLINRGILCRDGVRVGVTPRGRIRIGTERSSPLYVIAVAMNRNSDNFLAEMMAKTSGRVVKGAGTTVSGARVGASELTSAGVPANQYKLIDGSGLSRYNRLAPASLVTLERYAAGRPWGRYFDASLAVAGVNGALADRMRGTPAARVCHAKTGTLSDVSALSGYVTAKSGTRFAFSVVTNGADVTKSRVLQDRIAVFLATWTGR